MKQQFDRPAWNEHHFYASSVAEWRTNKDLELLIKRMKKDGYPFNLYYVPLPDDAPYKISNYVPLVEGIKFLGYWE